MGKKLSPYIKEARKVVRGWANIMRPIAANHPNFSWHDKQIEESYSDNKTRVNFTNLENFDMWADYKSSDKSEFVYIRTIAPFNSDGEDDKNMNLAARLVVPISECASAFGFKSKLITRDSFIGTCRYPAVTFGGDSTPNQFSDYIRLVNMAETLIDGFLLNTEKNRERPFKYVIAEHPAHSSEATLYPLERKEDLLKALGVFETYNKLKLNLDKPMIFCRADNLNRLEKQFAKEFGRVVGVNDYLKGK